MGIEINLKGLSVKGDSEILNNAKISSCSNDVHIDLEEIEIDGQAKLLNNLEITPILEQLRQQALNMDIDSKEYPAVQSILGVKGWEKEAFVKCIRKHVGDFSKGVLASIVANYITR